MTNRPAVAAALLAASLGSLGASARLYLWPDAPGPWFVPAPPPLEILPTARAATRTIEIRPGHNFVGALMSAGVRARMAAELAALFAKNGAELKKLRPGNALDVTWNFRREPIEVRYAPSPWVRFAARREDGSWAVTRGETEPDVRVASRFTYARPHPILGGTLPHLAVDYAAPPGTPVRAVADGTVTHAGWDGGYGLAVLIRHRSGYQTRYAHLSRVGRDVRGGARVNQRQVIGYVGSTGLSTGSHLHYEVIKAGRRVNPLGEKFIPGDPIPRAERAEFERYTHALIARLEAEAAF